MKLLKNHILKLENDLLKPEIRQSVEEVSELLSDGFTEFTSSGYIYNYNTGQVIDEGTDLQDMDWKIRDFEINQLSKDCILATYILIKDSELDENRKCSLRSSIWKCFDGKWKMIFHQGTLTSQL